MLWRLTGVLLGVLALAGGVRFGVDDYRDVISFRRAEPCAPGVTEPWRDCLVADTALVRSRRTYTTPGTEDSPPETHYRLTLERTSGRVQTKNVGEGVYDAAEPGSRVGLRLWHGSIVAVQAGGLTSKANPPSAGGLMAALMLGWAGVGLLLWSLVCDGSPHSLFGEMGHRAFGWLFLGGWTVMIWINALAYGLDSWWGVAFLAVFWLFGASIAIGFILPIDTLASRSWFSGRGLRRARASGSGARRGLGRRPRARRR
ncbi:hypothetical protein DPM19_21225 [Actinomadura craniellae]|uniref:Uncharacterized protein n=2 Tax=Actinomadura craniellae TaxID=2231787 RepID=A0A365H1R0_9ACTN|nr:hypothetical protein DPM19_21225 [Actinomadura craniellae]